jgi:hypothetical protein
VKNSITASQHPAAYRPRQIAAILRTTAPKVCRLITSGELAAINLPDKGGKPRYLVFPEDLQAFLERHRVTPVKLDMRPRKPVGQRA